jgi:NAD(P)-dependent dehydrogenase (short-subunit alcohol dehydrogenase family)
MALLDDKVAIVTGGGGNIGSATSLALAREGARVVVADLNIEGAKHAVAKINSEGGVACPVEVDLRSEESIAQMVQTAVKEFGRLDILHNNAAATKVARVKDLSVLDIDLDVWDLTFDVNVFGPIIASRYALPVMIDGGGGVIINTSSGAADSGNLVLTAYGASKSALIQFSYSLATQYGRSGIRCCVVQPGFTEDRDDSNREGAARSPDLMLSRNLIPRLGQPEDIANAVVFLCSDKASFITGIVLRVDGGSGAHAGLRFLADEPHNKD